MSQLCKKISITLVVFENRVETNANMKINFHVWTFTEQVHKQRKKASSDFSLSWQKNTKSPSCPQVKQFFSETSVLMCSRVILHHHAWSLVSDDLFWSLKAVLLKEAKRLYFFVTMEFFVSITFATELVHRSKKNEASTHCCFEKQTLKWQWREDKIICGKANSYFRRLSGPFRKNEEISKVVYFFSFGLKLKMKLVETVSVTIGVKFRQTSYASKTN